MEVEILSVSQLSDTAAINLTGNEFGQTINGNAGNNVIDGKGGNDTMSGLGGSDTFVMSASIHVTASAEAPSRALAC